MTKNKALYFFREKVKKLFSKKKRDFKKESRDLVNIILFYSLMFVILFLFEKNWVGSAVFFFFSLLIFFFRKKLATWVESKTIKANKRKIPLRVAFAKSIYLLCFFIIPLFLAFSFINGQWTTESGIQSSSSIHSGGIVHVVGDSAIKIIPRGNKYLSDARYFIGEILEIPVIDVCFSTSLNNLSKEDFISFKSQIVIEGENYDVPLNGEFCKETTIKEKRIGYNWTSDYQTKYLEILDFKTLNWVVDVRLNYRVIYMIILTILAWLVIVHLVYNVFKDFLAIGSKISVS